MCEGLDFTCDDLTSEVLLRCDEFRINNTYNSLKAIDL